MTSPSDVSAGAPAGAPAGVPGVDLVYAWVDGDDPELQADMRRYASGPDDLKGTHPLLRAPK